MLTWAEIHDAKQSGYKFVGNRHCPKCGHVCSEWKCGDDRRVIICPDCKQKWYGSEPKGEEHSV